MSEDIQKIEFDAFVAKGNWPILNPFTEDKEFGGFFDLGDTSLYAIPGKQTIPVRITIEKIEGGK